MVKFYLSKLEAKNKYENLRLNNFKCIETLSKDCEELRNKLLLAYDKAKQNKISDYRVDIKFGIELFDILDKALWFTKSLASNYDFWRYISICIIPEIIFDRFGDIPSHFYEKNVRIYPSTIYWYINIFKKESKEKTFDYLSLPCFSTDTILQTIERTGNETNVDVLREILNQYSKLEIKKIKENYCPINKFLRRILIQHMARSLVIIPEFYDGGIEGYVKMLIDSILNGVKNDK